MNADIMQAVRELIDFAESHAREVYGENETFEYGTTNGDDILAAAAIAQAYLDGDES